MKVNVSFDAVTAIIPVHGGPRYSPSVLYLSFPEDDRNDMADEE